jgi:hypothetical protein
VAYRSFAKYADIAASMRDKFMLGWVSWLGIEQSLLRWAATYRVSTSTSPSTPAITLKLRS